MNYKKSNIKKIKEYYKTSTSEGLNKEQVTAHRAKYGSNVFKKSKKKVFFKSF
nr:cation-transporting P-type ATPase [Lactococcus garvieae]